MYLCKVTGSVVSTRKHETFRPCKILVVHPVDLHGTVLPDAPEMLALDGYFGAGVGDYVLVAREGQVAAQVMHTDAIPANVVIMGVVDDWSCEHPS